MRIGTPGETTDIAGVRRSIDLEERVAILERLLQAALPKAGKIEATIRATADVGFLFIDGTSHVNAQTKYPALWAVIPAAWKSGSTMNLPDARGRTLFMDDAAAAFTLGVVGGSNTVTIASGNLPTHTHDMGHNHTQNAHTHIQNPHNHSMLYGWTAGADFRPQLATGVAVYGMAGENATATNQNATATNVAFVGSTGNGGFANTALGITNAHLAVNFQIKAH